MTSFAAHSPGFARCGVVKIDEFYLASIIPYLLELSAAVSVVITAFVGDLLTVEGEFS
jgi:hypothetical protein